MRGHWLKWVLVTCAVGLCLFLAAFGLLVFDFGGNQEIRLIRQSRSPDGALIAEVREVIEPMHGGSDSVQVLIAKSD